MHACMYENGMDMHVEKERMKAANKDEPLGAIGLGTVFFFFAEDWVVYNMGQLQTSNPRGLR